MADALVPLILALGACLVLWRKEDVYGALTDGSADGLRLLFSIAPSLIVLLSAVTMLRESGFLEGLARWLSPAFSRIGLPPELLPLMLVRPFSGSGALAVGAELMASYGPDSRIGRTAAVMLGSSETTFYAITVYFGAAGLKSTRHTVPAALCADLAGFFSAAVFTRLFFP